jgi:hypothetical protein
VRSDATSVAEYLDELPDDRRGDLKAVRASILAAIPSGVVETLNWGMISFEIPLERYPDTYNSQPLLFAALANQKRHMAVYLFALHLRRSDDPSGFRERVRGIRQADGYREIVRSLHTSGAAAT